MKNAHEIREGGTAAIFVRYRRQGDDGATVERLVEVLVDAADLPRVSRYTWRLNKGRSSPYVCADVPGQRGKKIWLHKLILGAGPATKVDHRNWNGLDCRRVNLRRATHSRNALHLRPQSRGATGERGVTYDDRRAERGAKRPWRASIQFVGKKRHLGYFATKEQAARAVEAELERRGVPVEDVSAEDYERAELARRIAREDMAARTREMRASRARAVKGSSAGARA